MVAVVPVEPDPDVVPVGVVVPPLDEPELVVVVPVDVPEPVVVVVPVDVELPEVVVDPVVEVADWVEVTPSDASETSWWIGGPPGG